MPESFTKDSAIRLFGMKIPLLVEDDSPGTVCQHSSSSEREGKEEAEKAEKDCPEEQIDENLQQDDASAPDTEESSGGQETLADTDVNPNTPSISEESAKSKASKSEKEQSDAANSQEKTLKKPDKILPCPRCHSMDTKFCYYNNYNVNQPRHFCKACQRYWTAGGTMRNVPVGAGRRKNKNSASHCRHMTISEALKAARIEATNGAQYPTLKPDGRVLSFGLDAPICDSMASVLNLVDKKVLNGTRNGYNSLEDPRIPVLCTGSKNVDNCSSGSSVTVANSREEVGRSGQKEPIPQNINGFASPVPCLPGVPWPYPWNSALPPPSFCPPGFPMPFCPAPYWNCGINGAWNIPLLSPQSSSSSNQTNTFAGPNSPTLGKHSRDASTLKQDDSERDATSRHKNGCIVVPKILRIDDPSEAAKSSIWTTLGIKNESLSNGGLFKAFKPKSTEKNGIPEPSLELRANPAALSRSINFHESS